MTLSGHVFDIDSRQTTPNGPYVVTISLNHPGKMPVLTVAVRDDDARTAYANAVLSTIDELKGFRTLQRKLIKEAILWL